jgi:ankyrin repeat protein
MTDAVMELLRDAGADPNLKDYTGRVPLLHVAGRPYACDKSISLLLSVTNRAELNCKDQYGQTMLLHCICQRRTWVALELIENQDVDPNITDSLGRPPLLYAASIGMEDTVIGLLRREDINVNCKDFTGSTTLSVACRRGDLGAVRYLLRRDELSFGRRGCFRTHSFIVGHDTGVQEHRNGAC